MNHIKNPLVLQKMNELFKSAGFEAFLVGGAVRDTLLGKDVHDWDIATNAKPKDVMSIFHKVIPTGIAHGTVTVLFMGNQIETTTYRIESDYSDGRHPDKVEYAGTIIEDLSRRDFTMNAIAASLEDGKIIDPFDGEKDIKNKTIKTVGKATERFTEDGLRPIRALRFASQLGFSIENNTYSAISEDKVIEKVKSISIERFRDEFVKILLSPKPSVGLKLLEDTNILSIFIPELTACRNCIQGDKRSFHDFDVLDHLFYATDGAPKEKINVRLASLFHDIGKPLVKKMQGDLCTFYNHEIVSAEITEKVLIRLKFPSATVNYVTHLVKQHMFHYESSWTNAAVRRFLIRVKDECLEDLFDLRLADVYGMHNKEIQFKNSETIKNLVELQKRIDAVKESNAALSLKDLAVTGKDLIANGIEPGKKLGVILNNLFETVVDDPGENTKEKLLEIAKNLDAKAKI